MGCHLLLPLPLFQCEITGQEEGRTRLPFEDMLKGVDGSSQEAPVVTRVADPVGLKTNMGSCLVKSVGEDAQRRERTRVKEVGSWI